VADEKNNERKDTRESTKEERSGDNEPRWRKAVEKSGIMARFEESRTVTNNFDSLPASSDIASKDPAIRISISDHAANQNVVTNDPVIDHGAADDIVAEVRSFG
jgi:hypothetical protein